MAIKVANKVTCSCGSRLAKGQLANHQKSRWHRAAKAARFLREAGLSYEEISKELARTVGVRLTKCRLHQKLSAEGL